MSQATRPSSSNSEALRLLREYVKAQSRMLDKWADGDDNVKRDLWRALHACEEPARALLAQENLPEPCSIEGMIASERARADKDNAAPQAAITPATASFPESDPVAEVSEKPAVAAPSAPPGVADVERILGGSQSPYTISDSTAAPDFALAKHHPEYTAPAEAPTPETDQAAVRGRLWRWSWYGEDSEYVPADISRRLERQRDATIDSRDRLSAGYQELQRELSATLSRERLANESKKGKGND